MRQSGVRKTGVFFLLAFLAGGVCFGEGVVIQAGSLGLNETWCPGVPAWFAEQAGSFDAAHPGIKVDLLGVEGSRRGRVAIEDLPVLARNVIGIDGVSGYEAAWLASRGDIVAIDKFLPDGDFKYEDFHENLWDAVRFDGKIWGVPLVGAPLVFVYRPDLLEKAGFREPPATWADLAACARAVAGTGGMPEGLQALYVEDVEQVVLTILVQQGDGLMRDNGFAPVFERVGETMDAVRPLLSFSGGGRREDNIELAAMAIGSPGFLNEIPRGMRSKWRIAPLPSSGKQVQSPYQMTYLAVRSAGPAYEAASWEFVKWLVRADAPRPGAVAGLGCRKSFAPGDEYLFQGIEHLWASLGQIVDYGPNNLMNRRAGLETLADAVEGLFEGRRNSSPGYGEILSKANGLMTVIHAPSRPAYALYR